MNNSFLFIVGTLNIGGVETYIKRLTINLLKKNNNIKINILLLTKSYDNEMFFELKNCVEIFFLSDFSFIPFKNSQLFDKLANVIIPINFKKLSNLIGHIDFIHTTSSETLLVANNLLKYNKNAKVISGIYHSKEYIWESNFYFRKVEKDIFVNFGEKNIISCNESSIDIINNHFKLNMNINIIPIGIDKPVDILYNKDSNKIVSIGRLVKFKTYNEQIMKILDSINTKYKLNLEYHIYGYGDNEIYLRNLSKNINSKVFFHGILNYSNFSNVLKDCLVFVGSGTSIIESSALGIPSIIGIESNNDGETYGFFSNLRGYSYNEDNLDIEKKTYYEILEILFTSLNMDELSISHKNKANEFLIDNTSNMFVNLCKKSLISSYFSYNKIRYSLSYFTWLILNKLKLNNELKTKFD